MKETDPDRRAFHRRVVRRTPPDKRHIIRTNSIITSAELPCSLQCAGSLYLCREHRVRVSYRHLGKQASTSARAQRASSRHPDLPLGVVVRSYDPLNAECLLCAPRGDRTTVKYPRVQGRLLDVSRWMRLSCERSAQRE
jgi:hypothetical protein